MRESCTRCESYELSKSEQGKFALRFLLTQRRTTIFEFNLLNQNGILRKQSACTCYTVTDNLRMLLFLTVGSS